MEETWGHQEREKTWAVDKWWVVWCGVGGSRKEQETQRTQASRLCESDNVVRRASVGDSEQTGIATRYGGTQEREGKGRKARLMVSPCPAKRPFPESEAASSTAPTSIFRVVVER